MSFLLKWLGLARPPSQVGLRPHRDVTLMASCDTAYDRVVDAMTTLLGANIYRADRTEHRIEVGFGLVNSERICVAIEPDGQAQSIVRIEARFPAASAAATTSRSVDALAEFLRS